MTITLNANLSTLAHFTPGEANGLATLGSDVKVPLSQLPTGVANGLATLGSDAKVPLSQLPNYVVGAMHFTGLWNASTNTPTLVSGVGTLGQYYKVSVAGTTNINGTNHWDVSDLIVFNGTTWDKIEGGSSEVTSVAGRTGNVTLTTADISGLTSLLNSLGTTYAYVGGSNASGTWPISISGNAATSTNAVNATNATNATYLSATQQTNIITGKTTPLSMSQDNGANPGSFICRAYGTGDGYLAGLSFLNDGYAIKLGIRADGYFGLGGWARSTWSWYSDPSGNMVAAGDVTAYSDPRLKENFQRVENPIELLQQLDGGTFTWKSGIAHTEIKAGKKDYGILADQVEKVMPEIVKDSIEIEGEVYKTVAYEKLVPVLIEAIKDLQKQIDELKKG